jgi:hypothetical protein
MSRQSSIDALNQLLAIHGRSLARYLADVRPWSVVPSNANWVDVIIGIAEGQHATIDRLAKLIMSNGGAVGSVGYPMAFTGINDLSLDFLLDELIADQQRIVVDIEASMGLFDTDPLTKSAAEEALGEAKGHLESLRELKSNPAPASIGA